MHEQLHYLLRYQIQYFELHNIHVDNTIGNSEFLSSNIVMF